MSRLINADKLKENISRWLKPSKPDESEMIEVTDALVSTMMEIDEQPTAFDVDKIVEQLEEVKKRYSKLSLAYNSSMGESDIKRYLGMEQAIALAIEIVKGGGVE